MLAAKAQVIALDPVGVWYGLRVGTSQSGSDFTIPIFGGLHGDVPLEPGAGEFIANLIVDRGISAVIDVSQFESDTQKAQFAKAFATKFFFRKKSSPSPVHLFLEEAQEFVPQNPQRDEALMLHAFHRVAKLGRNFGIGATLISQRPQEVNKKALNQTECLLAFQMTGPQERKTIETWIAEKGVNEDIRQILPHLKVGECHVWSPQWLRVNKTIKIAKKKTADVSSTPAAGKKQVEPKQLSDADLIALSKEMAATIERAKADDPKELRKKIAELDRDRRQILAHLEKHGSQRVEVIEKPVLKDGQLDKLLNYIGCVETHLRKREQIFAREYEKALGRFEADSRRLEVLLKPIGEALETLTPTREPFPPNLPDRSPLLTGQPTPKKPSRPEPAEVARPAITGASFSARPVERGGSGENHLPPRRQRILNALAFFESIGHPDEPREQIAFFCGVSPRSGTYEKDLGALRKAELIFYPEPGRVQLTEHGRGVSEPADALSLSEFHAMVFGLLPPRRQKIARALIEVHPASLTREELAERVGVSTRSGTYEKDLGAMRTASLVVFPQPGHVRATDLLFPPLP
jgi:hypothetical protein